MKKSTDLCTLTTSKPQSENNQIYTAYQHGWSTELAYWMVHCLQVIQNITYCILLALEGSVCTWGLLVLEVAIAQLQLSKASTYFTWTWSKIICAREMSWFQLQQIFTTKLAEPCEWNVHVTEKMNNSSLQISQNEDKTRIILWEIQVVSQSSTPRCSGGKQRCCLIYAHSWRNAFALPIQH